jgi:hypothetical protein
MTLLFWANNNVPGNNKMKRKNFIEVFQG